VSEVIRVLAVIAIIGYVIGCQLMGEPLRGKRVVVLPVILAVIGVVDLATGIPAGECLARHQRGQ
jgi:hypothetical protein